MDGPSWPEEVLLTALRVARIEGLPARGLG